MRDKKVSIDVPTPFDFQAVALEDPHRFKVWRWGRRAGKTRGMMHAAIKGHGAPDTDNFWRGMFAGGNVFWISRDNPQMEVIWHQEFKPRFKGREGIYWREQDKIIEVNGGFIDLRSFENIDSLRGQEADLVLIDEAAHWDLEYAWRTVVRAMLVDRKGSAIIASTTKVGSYFNALCERVRAGEMSSAWTECYHTASDNPLLDPAEIKEFIADYPDGSLDLEQEVFAKLVVAGGLAFNEWRDDIHVTNMVEPEGWTPVGCLDWGYASHGHFGLCFLGPDNEKFCRWELYFRELPPYDAGRAVGQGLHRFPKAEFITADSSMWEARDTVTVADYFQQGLNAELGKMAPALIAAPKGPGSRRTRKLLMHEALKWKPNPEDETKPPPPWLMPRMRFHPDCHVSIRTIPKLACDEKEPDKVDTLGDDHPFDSWSYLLNTITPTPERPKRYQATPDIHPGMDKKLDYRRKKQPWEEEYDAPEMTERRYTRST